MRTAKDNGRRQFDTFVNECILETSHRNKLPLLHAGQQWESNRSHHSKKEAEVFSRLYISCQTCESGTILPTWKSNLPTCLVWVEESSHKKKAGLAVVPWWLPKVQSESHPTTAVILDGVVITQMLKPGAAKTFEEYTHQNLLNLLKFIASRAVHCILPTLMIYACMHMLWVPPLSSLVMAHE